MDARHPLVLKSVLAYFIAIGVTGLVWPFFGPGPGSAMLSAQPSSLVTPTRVLHDIVAMGYIIAALAIIRRMDWAFRLTFYVLAISTLQSAKSFAWGFAHGRPPTTVYCFSLLLFFAWHVLLGYVVYRNCNGSEPTLR